MRNLNKVILIGNAAKQPDYKTLTGGIPVARFALATTENLRLKNGDLQTITDWHTIVVWRQLATFAGRYVIKGSLLYIEGRVRGRNYTNRENQKIYVTEVYAEQIILLDKKPKLQQESNEKDVLEKPPF